jgi:Zn-dependent peptidase ImmA (M78 family)
MRHAMNVDFNLGILEELIRQNTDKGTLVESRFPKINDWLKEAKKPTFNQLVSLANYFDVPFGYFFLDEVPQQEYPIPHFRTSNTRPFKPSNNLIETINILEERQEWAKDILIDLRSDALPFANSISTQTSIKTAAQMIRDILKLPVNWIKNENITTWGDAFGVLLKRTEDAGIFVVINGVVNNDTHKKLDVSEFRGFVLYNEFAPFIFINGNDFTSGKIFTLIHEITHVLTGKSASFDYKELLPADNAIERYCDSVAAEFLVPKDKLAVEYNKLGGNYDALAKEFKVSKLVIARRLLDSDLITKATFLESYKSYSGNEMKKSTSGGGNFYNTAPYRISKRFFNLIYSSVKQNKILYREAFQLTGLSGKSFDGYVKTHFDTIDK